MKEIKTYPIVNVLWEDHVAYSGSWANEKIILKKLGSSPHLIENVGYLLKETPEYLYLTDSVGCTGELGHSWKLLKKVVVKMEYLDQK